MPADDRYLAQARHGILARWCSTDDRLSSSSGERCRRRRLQRGHRDSPEPTVTATAPFLNRCLTRGYGPLQGSAKHCRPYDPRAETVATPWTPQTGGATVAPPSWYHMTRGVGAA